MTLSRLDYLYTPSDDVAADMRYLVDVLGAELGFAIADGGIRVAMVTLGGPPAILLTDHLEGDRPIHVYAVDDLAATSLDLEARGWQRERAASSSISRTNRAAGSTRLFRAKPSRGQAKDETERLRRNGAARRTLDARERSCRTVMQCGLSRIVA